jgi:hypothetical protein
MTANRKRTETAGGAGAKALCGVFARTRLDGVGRTVRPLRWKQDAVCRDAAADAGLREPEADSADSSLTRTNFYTSRIQTQPTTRKETLNTTQEKKGKQKQNTVTIRKKLETLA